MVGFELSAVVDSIHWLAVPVSRPDSAIPAEQMLGNEIGVHDLVGGAKHPIPLVAQ